MATKSKNKYGPSHPRIFNQPDGARVCTKILQGALEMAEEQGLTSNEAEERIKKYGENILELKKKVSGFVSSPFFGGPSLG